MKKVYNIVLFVLLISPLVKPQYLTEPSDFFGSIFKSKEKINSFYTGGNPAFLRYDLTDELLSIKTAYNNEQGDYRRFIDPETNRLYELSFTGKKSIDSQQVFKGSFGVQRMERKNWNRIFTKNLQDWNPYLIGDLSTGDAHFNGIVMNASYGALIYDRLLAGFNFNYSVDQGLKDVFPHPTSEHRDINIKFGAGYILNKDMTVGGYLDICDNSERIEYQADEEEVTRETILYKYRGYGLPVVYNKKDEDRNSFNNKYAGYVTFSARISNSISSALFIGGGMEHTSITDGDSKPQSEGYLKNTFYKGGADLLWNITDKINAGLDYNFIVNNIWAKHPDYDVLMMENSYPDHKIQAGVDYRVNKNVKAGFEAAVNISQIDYKDYYSSLFWKTQHLAYEIKVGGDFVFTENLTGCIYAGYEACNASDNKFTYNGDVETRPAVAFRTDDIKYYQSNYDRFNFSFIPCYSIGQLGLVKLYLTYSQIKPDEALWFVGAKKETIDAVLEFRLNVY